MQKNSKKITKSKAAVAGIDLGKKSSEVCLLDSDGVIIERRKIRTTKKSFEALFGMLPRLRVALETGPSSNWVARLLDELGHETIVADAQRVKIITDTYSKDDRRDAHWLAQIALRWPALLNPVRRRSLETQRHRAMLRLREGLVEARTKLINAVRGVLTSFGEQLPASNGNYFAHKAMSELPESLRDQVWPALLAIDALSAQIQVYDRMVSKLCRERYRAATKRMQSIPGVGPMTALAFTLELDGDPDWLRSSRSAGALVGLRPKRRDSGEKSPELSITKKGNRMLRRLLVQCAHHILGPFGPDSALRRWGLSLEAKSETKRGKRKAIVAVARKLAVILHTLWRRDEDYDPLYGLPQTT